MRKIMLFISSYIPLYILLIIKNILERCTADGKFNFSFHQLKNAHYFDEVNDYAIVFLAILSVVSFLYLKRLAAKPAGRHYYKVVSIEDQTGNMYFSYISVYLLSCSGLTLNKIADVFVLLFLMMLVGYVYIKNHMTYLNPVLQFLGYKIYEGSVYAEGTNEEFHSVIIADEKIAVVEKKRYLGSGKEDFLLFIRKAEE